MWFSSVKPKQTNKKKSCDVCNFLDWCQTFFWCELFPLLLFVPNFYFAINILTVNFMHPCPCVKCWCFKRFYIVCWFKSLFVLLCDISPLFSHLFLKNLWNNTEHTLPLVIFKHGKSWKKSIVQLKMQYWTYAVNYSVAQIIVPGSSRSTSRFDYKNLQRAGPTAFLRMFTIATCPPLCSGVAPSTTLVPQYPAQAAGSC